MTQSAHSTHSRPRYRVPDDLRETLLDFTIAYLLERPANVTDFGLDFFQRLRAARAGGGGGGPMFSSANIEGRSFSEQAPGSPSNLPVEYMEPSETTLQQERKSADATAPPVKVGGDGRRKSVFAETYNPEEDEEEAPTPAQPKTDAQRTQLGSAVKGILLFRSLDSDQIQEVIDAMFQKTVKAGDFVIKQGDDGDNFYVIETGKYKVMVEAEGGSKVVANYNGAGSFGELALMYNMPRAASVQAETDGSLWAMDRQTFRRIVLKNAFKKRQMYESLIDSVPMLKTLQNYERMNLADALVPRSFNSGETIIKQNDTADGMYFVESGEVKVVTNEGGKEVELNRVSKGGYFGELALLTKKPRAATVIAVEKVKAAFLDAEAFERLLGPCIDVMKRNAADYKQQLERMLGSKSASELSEMR